MKQNALNIKVRLTRAVFAASVAALAALPGYGQQAGAPAQTGAGTTTGTTGTGVGATDAQGNTGTFPIELGETPTGTDVRRPIPAGSSPPSNTTITNPTGTFDRGGNPTLTIPLGTGGAGTVPAYGTNSGTVPADVPANPTNGVRKDGPVNNQANPATPAIPDNTRSNAPTGAGTGTGGRDYE